ncbi:hypothetical protein CDAR_480111 [Caerostris darwini]|uniref:Uncharacterized protein n=1 Tax=Caerostris darwini TaxID=1538125 RepID=A0AAV4T6S1_9ARAC|nr:hypothetical protein CDAR_480111 [Caerostris darwini]
MGFERASVSFPEAFLTNARIDLSQCYWGRYGQKCLNYFRGLKRQQWPFQSPPDRANPQQFPGECFPGDIRQSPEASANNVTLRNCFKRYFFSPGLYGAAESHKLALGSIRVVRPLLDILEFGWALRGSPFHFLQPF